MAWKMKIVWETPDRAQQAQIQLKPIGIGFLFAMRQEGTVLARALTHDEVKAMVKAIEDHYHEYDKE